MTTVWNVYIIDADGKEVFLCVCRSAEALSGVVTALANLNNDGPYQFRLTRLEVDGA